MNKIAVVYWSSTGNTEEMAAHVAEGAREAGAEVSILPTDEFSADAIDTYDAIAFGCPSMGDEVLEETEFQPLWNSVEPKLKGKNIALFGSYGWGDGEWMRNWEKACQSAGLTLACGCVTCTEEPDDEAKQSCRVLGAALANVY